MTVKECLDAIESHDMATRINLASGVNSALEIARSQPTVRSLATMIVIEEVAERVLQRVVALAQRSTDVRYEHPYDAALMIYTLLLSEWSEEFGFAAAAVVSQLSNLWWAATLATGILARSIEPGPVASSVSDDVGLAVAGRDSGDVLFVSDVRLVLSVGNVAPGKIMNIDEAAGFVEQAS